MQRRIALAVLNTVRAQRFLDELFCNHENSNLFIFLFKDHTEEKFVNIALLEAYRLDAVDLCFSPESVACKRCAHRILWSVIW